VPEILDAVDARILDLIQHDAGLSVAEIAERVGLSSSPCWRRIKRLEDTGVIQRRVTILDREKLGLGFEVYATVKLSLPTKDNLDAFEQAVLRWPEVVQCATVTGAADYELRIVTRDMHAFDAFLRDKICRWGWSATSRAAS
jgi:DNA-binding Lrp family transcriptional regulator